jgi:hypothetical protein
MINSSERAYIAEHAYLPEHLPDYVSAISDTEPYLIGDFVLHVRADCVIFVGYPLVGEWHEARLLAALEQAQTRFNPAHISVITPVIPASFDDWVSSPADDYYRLDLAQLLIPKKIRNMLRRARREVNISHGQFDREHKKLLNKFLRGSNFDKATRFIFQRLPEYIATDSAQLYDARNTQGDLIAFDVAEIGARNYAFYMFNVCPRKANFPGASDLLLAYIIEQAQAQGKRYLNLGLGIHPGIQFFKQKWGGDAFLKHFNYSKNTGQSAAPWNTVDSFLR